MDLMSHENCAKGHWRYIIVQKPFQTHTQKKKKEKKITLKINYEI